MRNSINKALIIASAGAIIAPAVGVAAPKKGAKKPNILYIMSDDHTSQAIGVYGSRLAELNPTPTIDAMAKEGVIFDNVFCGNSISTPSRASIMTGQYSHVNRIFTLDEKLVPEQQYLVQEMSKLGYQSAMVGKWHLGCEPKYFDYYSVFTEAGEQGKYFDPLLASSDDKSKPFPNNTTRHKGYSSDIVTDVTLDWFQNKRDPEKPFFVMHHYKAPHDDFEFAPRYAEYLEDVDIPVPSTLLDREGFGSEGTRGKNNELEGWLATSVSSRNTYRNYVDMYKIDLGNDEKNTIAAYNEYLKRYLRCVKGVDDNLARLFKYLKDEGLWDNTIIVYTGDQGMMLGEHDLQDKRWMYDECARMPFIMRVPDAVAKAKGGVHNKMMIQNVDFAPTLLSLAGKEETPKYMQGKDFSAIFSGKQPAEWRKAIYYRYWMHLMHHNVPAHFGIRTQDYKLIFFYGLHYNPACYGTTSMPWIKENTPLIKPTPASFELYDLRKDPEEKRNVVNDPAYAEIFEKLKTQLLELKAEVRDTDEQNPDIVKVIKANF